VAGDQQLFKTTDAFVLNVAHHGANGWQVRFARRAHLQPWGDVCWEEYTHLSSREMIQLVEDLVSSVL